jgi:hypothetical protein
MAWAGPQATATNPSPLIRVPSCSEIVRTSPFNSVAAPSPAALACRAPDAVEFVGAARADFFGAKKN